MAHSTSLAASLSVKNSRPGCLIVFVPSTKEYVFHIAQTWLIETFVDATSVFSPFFLVLYSLLSCLFSVWSLIVVSAGIAWDHSYGYKGVRSTRNTMYKQFCQEQRWLTFTLIANIKPTLLLRGISPPQWSDHEYSSSSPPKVHRSTDIKPKSCIRDRRVPWRFHNFHLFPSVDSGSFDLLRIRHRFFISSRSECLGYATMQ